MGVALSCKGTTLAKKKPICAEMTINTFELCLFTEEDQGEIGVLAISRMSFCTNVAVYFTTFENVILSRNTRRPCNISKRAYSSRV